MEGDQSNGSSATRDGRGGEDDGGPRVRAGGDPARGRNPVDDPTRHLPADLTLPDFEGVVEASTTILEVQRETRLPRWKVKRLLNYTGRWDDLETTAQRVAELRDGDQNSDR